MLTVFTKPSCPGCTILKSELTDRNIAFTEVGLSTAEAISAFKAKYPAVRSVPYVIDEEGNQVAHPLS